MKRASLYVDGNALFHAIDDMNEPALKWLDIRRLGEGISNNAVSFQRIVFAYTVTGEDRSRAQQKRTYLRALAAQGVECMVEDPIREYHECARCGHGWDERKPSRNDSDLGIEIVHDAWSDAFDEAWLITDQIAESHLTRKLAVFPGKSITLVSLRNVPRLMHDTDNLRRKTLTKRHLRSALLSEQVTTKDGETITRPRSWAPRESATWSDLEITGL